MNVIIIVFTNFTVIYPDDFYDCIKIFYDFRINLYDKDKVVIGQTEDSM